MARNPAIGASARPETIHDFGGFDPALLKLRYPAPGNPALAQRAAELLQAAGLTAPLDPDRGLDHGVWVPLSIMFPQADIPIVPLAMPWPLDPNGAYRLGEALSPLSRDDVLLVGTGSLTHNLNEFVPNAATGEPPQAYVVGFVDWMRRTIERGDIEALLAYRLRAPDAVRAHPTEEHLLPLFWALGAARGGAKPRYVAGGVHYGMLSMDAWMFT
jgi:4,5-DOPA dioxygenase extradiol